MKGVYTKDYLDENLCEQTPRIDLIDTLQKDEPISAPPTQTIPTIALSISLMQMFFMNVLRKSVDALFRISSVSKAEGS